MRSDNTTVLSWRPSLHRPISHAARLVSYVVPFDGLPWFARSCVKLLPGPHQNPITTDQLRNLSLIPMVLRYRVADLLFSSTRPYRESNLDQLANTRLAGNFEPVCTTDTTQFFRRFFHRQSNRGVISTSLPHPADFRLPDQVQGRTHRTALILSTRQPCRWLTSSLSRSFESSPNPS